MKPLTSAEEDTFKVSTPAGKGADRQRPLSVVFVGREAAPGDDRPQEGKIPGKQISLVAMQLESPQGSGRKDIMTVGTFRERNTSHPREWPLCSPACDCGLKSIKKILLSHSKICL